MTITPAQHNTLQGFHIDKEAVLKSLNLNPRDPKTQALLLVCDRYQLDPLLKHMVLISGNAYVTRDGYLAVAHRSGQFDGMEVLEETETNTHYKAKVAVYRRDMTHPFTFVGRFPKSKQMAKDYGPEMAVKVAEVMALRRAFNVTGVSAADERWDDEAIPPSEEPSQPEDSDFDVAPLAAQALQLPVDLKQKLVDDMKTRGIGSLKQGASRPVTRDELPEVRRLLDQALETVDARRKRANAVMSTVGVTEDEARHALVREATMGETESTAGLSEAQLAAVVDQCEFLLEQRRMAAEAEQQQ